MGPRWKEVCSIVGLPQSIWETPAARAAPPAVCTNPLRRRNQNDKGLSGHELSVKPTSSASLADSQRAIRSPTPARHATWRKDYPVARPVAPMRDGSSGNQPADQNMAEWALASSKALMRAGGIREDLQRGRLFRCSKALARPLPTTERFGSAREEGAHPARSESVGEKVVRYPCPKPMQHGAHRSENNAARSTAIITSSTATSAGRAGGSFGQLCHHIARFTDEPGPRKSARSCRERHARTQVPKARGTDAFRAFPPPNTTIEGNVRVAGGNVIIPARAVRQADERLRPRTLRQSDPELGVAAARWRRRTRDGKRA